MAPDAEPVHTEFVAGAASYSVVTALSHAGLVRDHNEDSLVIGQWTLCAAETETPQTLVFPIASPLVVAVADGLGGHPGGDVASSLVVRELARAAPTLDSEQSLRDVLNSCNRALYGIAADQPMLMAMGPIKYSRSTLETVGSTPMGRMDFDRSASMTAHRWLLARNTPLSSPRLSVEDSPTPTLSHMWRHFHGRPKCAG
jgi:hypothetical protein